MDGDQSPRQRREQRAFLRAGAHLQGIFRSRQAQRGLPPRPEQMQRLIDLDDADPLHLSGDFDVQRLRAARDDVQRIFMPRRVSPVTPRVFSVPRSAFPPPRQALSPPRNVCDIIIRL